MLTAPGRSCHALLTYDHTDGRKNAAIETGGRLSGAQDAEPAKRLGEDLLLFAERKAHLELPGVRVVVEDNTWNGHHAGLVGQFAAEFHAIQVTERTDGRRDEVRAIRRVDLEAGRGQSVAHHV